MADCTREIEVLDRVIDGAFACNESLDKGTMDRLEALPRSRNFSIIVAAVGQRIKARLAAPRLAAFEAKQIEAAKQATIAGPSAQ